MIPIVQYLGTAVLIGSAVLCLIAAVLALGYRRWMESGCQRDHDCPPRHEQQEELVQKPLSQHELKETVSLDCQLDALSQKLAEKESKLKLSRSRIRETQQVMDNIPKAIDSDVRTKYQDIMNNLKFDLQYNETECKKIQDEIEWISRKRAQLKTDVRQGQHLYSQAAADLAYNLQELQKGKVPDAPTQSLSSIRQRSQNILNNYRPSATGSIIVKSVSDTEHSGALNAF